MKNKREIYKALLDGKKIYFEHWKNANKYIYLSCDGDLIDQNMDLVDNEFYNHKDWHIYREHFDIKRAVELARKNDYEDIVIREAWCETGIHLHVYLNCIEKLDKLGNQLRWHYNDIMATDYYIIEGT